MTSATDSELLVVLAPYGRDAQLACTLLRRAGYETRIARNMKELCELAADSGALLVAEEGLASPDRSTLQATLAQQPPWSDLPVIVFGSPSAAMSDKKHEALTSLGNVTLVERPFAVGVLLTAVGNVLRARRRQYEARRAIQQRDQFLAMLGHELRNPLAAIALTVPAFEHGDDPARVQRHAAVLKRQTEHLARIVDDLLDVSRVTSGKIVINRKPVELEALVKRCVSTLQSVAGKSGLQLAVSQSEEAWVNGDAIRLEQVLNNLLGNAIKYTPAGGRVEAVVQRDGAEAVVRVMDTGVGIAPEMLPRVFDLFSQAPSSLDRSRGGLGIGLTLVRNLLDLHGGSVTAASSGLGRGSAFTVRLPLVPAPAVVADNDNLAAAIPVNGRRVLVVDDNEDARETLRDLLEGHGFRVETAVDGPSGLTRLLEGDIDVALIDIGLPGIDGYELVRRARRFLPRHVLLVAISGYGLPQDKEAARAAGFDEHFTKPVDVDGLRRLLFMAPGVQIQAATHDAAT